MNLTELPLTHSISDDEINHLISSKEKKNFLHLHCYMQAVERCIKLITEASTLVCGKILEIVLFVQKSNRVKNAKF